jgi:hypothetical protein
MVGSIIYPSCRKIICVILLIQIEKVRFNLMDQIIKVAWDLNENTDNRYKLVYEIAELAKKIVDENQARKAREDFGFDEVHEATYSRENPVEHALMVKASEADDNRLVG